MSNVVIVQNGYDKEDPLSTLKVVTKPIPKPAPGQEVVHIKLRSINPSDFITLRLGGIAQGGTCGAEGVGIVHEVGEGVQSVHKGQRVIPFTAHWSLSGKGSYQKYVCLDEDFVWPVADYMSDDVAAPFVINLWASYVLALEGPPSAERRVHESERGRVHSWEASDLARQALGHQDDQLRAEQKAELKALGADEVICSADEDIVARVQEITGGKGAWGGLDAVCGTMTATLAASVRADG